MNSRRFMQPPPTEVQHGITFRCLRPPTIPHCAATAAAIVASVRNTLHREAFVDGCAWGGAANTREAHTYLLNMYSRKLL